MSIRVSFAGREIMRLPDELIEPLQQLCDAIGTTCRRDRAGDELAIISPLEGRAIGLLAQPGDTAAAEVVARLKDRLSVAGALVREVPGDVCVAFLSRPRGRFGRPPIRVLYGLRGYAAHRRLAALLAEHIAGTSGGDPSLSLSAGKWLGGWGDWQRPSALVEITAGEAATGLLEDCVRGTYQAMLRHFAACKPVARPAGRPEPNALPVAAEADAQTETKALAPVAGIRIIRQSGRSRPQPLLLPPGAPPSEASGPFLLAAAETTARSRPASVVWEQPGGGIPGATPAPGNPVEGGQPEAHISPTRQYAAPPPSTGTQGGWERNRQPWFTGRWGCNDPGTTGGRHKG